MTPTTVTSDPPPIRTPTAGTAIASAGSALQPLRPIRSWRGELHERPAYYDPRQAGYLPVRPAAAGGPLERAAGVDATCPVPAECNTFGWHGAGQLGSMPCQRCGSYSLRYTPTPWEPWAGQKVARSLDKQAYYGRVVS